MEKKKKTPRKVNVEDSREIRNLATSFQVTKEDILHAIQIVGNVYNDLRSHFDVHRNPYVNRTASGRWGL